MDGWSLPLAPERAFSLALAQECVGVMQFDSPAQVLEMNFAAVVLGAKGLDGPPGAGIDNFASDPLVAYILSKN